MDKPLLTPEEWADKIRLQLDRLAPEFARRGLDTKLWRWTVAETIREAVEQAAKKAYDEVADKITDTMMKSFTPPPGLLALSANIKAIDDAVAVEREACAQVAESVSTDHTAHLVAKRIRDRGSDEEAD